MPTPALSLSLDSSQHLLLGAARGLWSDSSLPASVQLFLTSVSGQCGRRPGYHRPLPPDSHVLTRFLSADLCVGTPTPCSWLPWVDHCSVSSCTPLFQLLLGVTIRMNLYSPKGCIFGGFPTSTLRNLNMVSGVSVVGSVFFRQTWSVHR